MQEKSQDLRPEVVAERAEQSQPTPARTITICVTKGRSACAMHRLTKTRTTIGNIEGAADMRIDDPDISSLHCAVAITGDGVRLYDLGSKNGTYVDDEKIEVADLDNLSAFRIGSSELVIYFVANHNLDSV